MKIKLTEGLIRDHKAPAKLVDYSDIACKGLHLRIQPTGTKTFVMSYRSRITGKPENKVLGRYPEVSLAVARSKVNQAWELAADSKPVEFTEAKKNAGEMTVDDAVAKYAESHLSERRSGAAIHVVLTTTVARHKWGSRALASLTKSDIKVAVNHIKVERNAPQSANKTQQKLSTFLQWACNEEIIPFNPVRGMSQIAKGSTPRKRRLDEVEIRALWKACHDPKAHRMHRRYADALMMQLATAARSGMICGLKRGYLFNTPDGPKTAWGDKGAVADFPGEAMKQGRDFVMPLNALAVDILRRQNGIGDYVFPSSSDHIEDKGKSLNEQYLAFMTRRLSKELGFTAAFTPHDLRRTAASLLRREGYTRDEVGMFLAHEAGGDRVMAHYDAEDRWDHLAKKREMADKLAAILKRIIFGDGVIRVVA